MDAGTLIRILHLGFVLWMIYAPFSGIEEFLLLHVVICPFLMLHWMLPRESSTGCALTILEKKVRGLEHDDESFIHSIVAPIYAIDDASLRPIVWIATVVLWLITISRLKRPLSIWPLSGSRR
jgi:hypothetical protein